MPEVRERFDYLYDEILRQLAEGDPKKLGAGAPTNAKAAPPPREEEPSPVIPITPGDEDDEDGDAKTSTVQKTVEATTAPPEAAPPEAAPPKAAAPAASPPPAAADGKPSGVAARALPLNPETAELEKGDARHAAARRLARLSVSEIKLYHEDEVKAGREAKDLWKRLSQDIALATSTFEKRVDKEVRDRFDYLYDEILRQLAEGDIAKLGAGVPARKEAPATPVATAPSEPKLATAEPRPSEPKLPARFAPVANPATAELEKGDARHAAARRLARLSVSEIKLYHEDEVKAGREAKDLWKRLISDIGLATQTYEKRVDKEVRERFDYLYDEILRQLAEGDIEKLGPDAPKR